MRNLLWARAFDGALKTVTASATLFLGCVALGFVSRLPAQAPADPQGLQVVVSIPNVPSTGPKTFNGTPEELAALQTGATMFAALRLRTDVAQAVAADGNGVEEAIAKLRADPAPSGLESDASAGFAYAAIDVGRRLIAARKPVAAERVFRAAEESLDGLVRVMSDQEAQLKARLLESLATIRSHYLNKTVQAKVDIERAIALQPDAKNLQRTQANIARTNGQLFPSNPKG